MKKLFFITILFLFYSVYTHSAEWVWTREAILVPPTASVLPPKSKLSDNFQELSERRHIMKIFEMNRYSSPNESIIYKSKDAGITWEYVAGDTTNNYFMGQKIYTSIMSNRNIKNPNEFMIFMNNCIVGSATYPFYHILLIKDDVNNTIIHYPVDIPDGFRVQDASFYGIKNCLYSIIKEVRKNNKVERVVKWYISNDTLKTFKEIFSSDTATVGISKFNLFSDSGICYRTSENIVYVTNDLGNTWETFEYDKSFDSILNFSAEEATKSLIFKNKDYDIGYIYSDDKGLTWDTLPMPSYLDDRHKRGQLIQISKDEIIVILEDTSNNVIDYSFDSLDRAVRITSISEQPMNNVKLSPNPTSSDATLTFDLQTAGNLKIILNDLLGQELLELHNNFEQTGTFTKTFSTFDLPKGTYYLKIFIGKDIKVEKLVVN